jgi:hypothetical protein
MAKVTRAGHWTANISVIKYKASTAFDSRWVPPVAIQGYKGIIDTQSEMESCIKYQSAATELNKKAKNPNRVTGGKRGRPRGSKSKAVGFSADAMPDRNLVPFGSRAEVAAALM